jgi:hypothetical protein
MKVVRYLGYISISIVALLLATNTQTWAVAVGGPASGLGVAPLGGELRGITGISGRVICARCDLDQVQNSQPGLVGLYELQHRQGQVVMQIIRPQEASAAAWWEAIVGLTHEMAVRTPDSVFAQLMAEENLNRRVGIQGLLRPTRTYDVTSIIFLEPVRRPLSRATPSAADRAEAAASQAEDAATRVERAAERLDAASKAAEAQFESQLRK